MPYTTQAIFNKAAQGYGQSSGDGGESKQPDLKAYLERPLKYFKELEAIG